MFMIEWKPTPSIEELNKNYLDEYCRCFHSNVVATIGYCVATPVYKRYYKYLGDCIKSVMQLDVAEINGNKNFERLCRDLHKTEPRTTKSSFLKTYCAKKKAHHPDRFMRVNSMFEHSDEVFDGYFAVPIAESCLDNIPDEIKDMAVLYPDHVESFWFFCDIADMMFAIAHQNDELT